MAEPIEGKAAALHRPTPDDTEIADVLAEQAAREAALTPRLLALARRIGLSLDACNIAMDDIRRRHDCILLARQIVLERRVSVAT